MVSTASQERLQQSCVTLVSMTTQPNSLDDFTQRPRGLAAVSMLNLLKPILHHKMVLLKDHVLPSESTEDHYGHFLRPCFESPHLLRLGIWQYGRRLSQSLHQNSGTLSPWRLICPLLLQSFGSSEQCLFVWYFLSSRLSLASFFFYVVACIFWLWF